MNANEYHSKLDDLSLPLKFACTRSVIIEYFKPWSGNRSSELNSLKTGSSYSILGQVEADPIHQELAELRNNLYGHIDQDF